MKAGLLRSISQHDRNALVEILKSEQAARSQGISPSFDGDLTSGAGNTPLMLAVRSKNEEILKALLESGLFIASLDRKDQKGDTLLHFAVNTLQFNSINLLLSFGAYVDPKDRKGRTPLLLACDWLLKSRREEETSWLQVVEVLLKHGADVKSQDREERSPALLANRARKYPALSSLFKKIPQRKNDKQWNSLCAAIKRCHRSKVEEIMKTCRSIKQNINGVTGKGHSLLYLAVKTGRLDIVKAVVENGCDPSLHNNKGESPLHAAVATGNKDIAQYLLNQKASLLARDHKGHLPLDVALKRKDLAMAALLTPDWTIYSNKDRRRWSDSVIAICDQEADNMDYTKDEPVLEFLITHLRVDVNQPNRTGWNPLHFAANRKNSRLIRFLVDTFKADLNSVTNELWTPMHIFLGSHEDYIPSDEKEQLILFMHEHGADFSKKTDKGWTCLHTAIRNLESVAVDLILRCQNGAKEPNPKLVNMKTKMQWSPLCIALQWANVDDSMVRLLLDNDADVEYFHLSTRKNDNKKKEKNKKKNKKNKIKKRKEKQNNKNKNNKSNNVNNNTNSKEKQKKNNNKKQKKKHKSFPLCFAVHKGLDSLVSLLIQKGAKIN